MSLYLLRAVFVLLLASVGFSYAARGNWGPLPLAMLLALLVLAIDTFSSRRKLLNLSAIFFGTLVGLLIAYALGNVVSWLLDTYIGQSGPVLDVWTAFSRMMLNIVCCYLMISFIMQTKDDFRFIIPYVEFARQARGTRPMLLDTSVLIDGRIVDVAEVGMVDSRLVVPRIVLEELQQLADSTDKLRRNRGRRGLDMVEHLQHSTKVDVVIYEGSPRNAEQEAVDMQLIALAEELDGRLVTTDSNLSRIATLRGVTAINVNDLATAVKPIVLPGENINVELIKPGEQQGQAVGYLDDGTMVVVEQARQFIGRGVAGVTVTSMVQTSAGRMIFARIEHEPGAKPAAPSVAGQS